MPHSWEEHLEADAKRRKVMEDMRSATRDNYVARRNAVLEQLAEDGEITAEQVEELRQD